MKKNILPTIGIVILNINLYEDTVKCINSLKKFIKSASIQIVVVDNGSEVSEKNKLKKIDDICLISNVLNEGYAKGNNQAISYFIKKKRKPDFILLMNNDVFCVNDFLEPLLKVMNINLKIASVNPLIYFSSEPNKIWSSGGVINLKKGLMTSDYYHHLRSWKNLKGPYFVDWNTGCVNLFRTCVFEKIGLLSEKLEMYVEDVELSLRLRRRGYFCVVVPETIIYHSVSKSSTRIQRIRPRYYISRNTVIVAKKYLVNPYRFIFLNFFNQLYQSIMGKNKILLLYYTVKGTLDGLRFKNNSFI